MGKEKKLSESESESLVKQYMKDQNRPYNVQTLIDNLHGQVGKTTATKVLDKLVETQELSSKEFGKSKLYWYNQENIKPMSEKELAETDVQIKQLDQEVNSLQEETKTSSDQLAIILATPTTSEANAKTEKLKLEISKMKDRIQTIESKGVVLSPIDRANAEKEYEQYRLQWRKRKRMCSNIVGELCDRIEKKPKELIEEIGLETDELSSVSIDNDKTSRLKRGEMTEE